GPGRGTLMADALRALSVVPDFRHAIRVHLVETSPTMRNAQAKALETAAPVWHERLDTIPPGPMLLIANKFLAALPIRQFEWHGDGWHERRVGLAPDGHALAFALDPDSSLAATLIPRELAGAPLGSVAEVRPAALALARDVTMRLSQD